MDPDTTEIFTLVSYLGGKGFDKAFDTAAGEFTKDSISWLKSIFFKEDNKPKEVLEDLQKDSQDKIYQDAAVLTIKKGLRENPKAEKWVQEIVDVIKSKQAMTIISHSKNVSTAPIQTGGNVTFGDNNQ